MLYAISDRALHRRWHLKSRIVLLLLLFILMMLGGCRDDVSRLSLHLTRADDYFEQERFAEAAIEYQNSLQIEPNDSETHYRLAQTYYELKKPAKYFWELRETVRLDPSNTEAVIAFSRIAILAKEADEALRSLDALLALQLDANSQAVGGGLGHDNTQARLVRGQALEALGRHDEANQTYQRAVAGAPEDQAALHALARSETRAQRKAKARSAWERLVEVHPSFQNYTLMARAAPQLVEEPESIAPLREQLLRHALEIAESDDRPRAYEQLANLLVVNRRVPEAFALLEKGANAEDQPVEIIYILARLHRAEGNLERADQLLEEAAEARPEEPRVHRVVAGYRARLGDLEGALTSLDRAAVLEPNDILTKIQRAEILMELGFRQQRENDVAQAHVILTEILEIHPRNPFALVADAKYQINRKHPEQALLQLKTSLEVKPDWAEAHYLQGVAFASLKDFLKARAELGRALELDSNLLGAKAALVDTHFQLGEWRYCIGRGREYLRAVPTNNKVRLQIAESMVRLGLPEAAIAELQRIPEAARDEEVRFALGRIALSRGDLNRARSGFEAAAQASPHHPEILEALVAVDQLEDRIDDSKARIAAALEVKPENPQLYRLRGVLSFNDGQIDEAEADFKRAIELDPQDLQGYERLARFYARIGQLERTAEVYESAIAVVPEASGIHHALGTLRESLDQPERAIPSYELAIRYQSNNVEAMNNLAYLYADRGEQLGRALDLAREARALLPDNPSIADTLGWVLHKRGLSTSAVGYLQEAATNTDPNAATIAMIRYHLAEALAAAGEPVAALESVEQSLKDLTAQRFASLQSGQPSEISDKWASDARVLRARLESAKTAGN